MLPPSRDRPVARSRTWWIIAAVVDLPAVPVTPITRCRSRRSTRRRISVVTLIPARRAHSRWRFVQGFGTAGLATTRSHEVKSAVS